MKAITRACLCQWRRRLNTHPQPANRSSNFAYRAASDLDEVAWRLGIEPNAIS
jgi:hypothetical protein